MRYIWTCLRNTQFARRESVFAKFTGSLYEARWHEVASALYANARDPQGPQGLAPAPPNRSMLSAVPPSRSLLMKRFAAMQNRTD